MSNHPGINAALFNFCCAVDDGPRTETVSQLPQRDPAELKWLREALESIEAPERTVKRCLEVLLTESATIDSIVETLEELSDVVEDLNWAVEFALMNGHVVVLRMLESDPRARQSAEVRRLLAMVVAHACQQNDKVQTAFNQSKWADVIVPLTKREEDKQALAALLHACSCMCRECDAGSAAFLGAGGIELLTRLLSPEMASKVNEKIANRVLFLVSYFSQIGVSSEALIENLCTKVVLGTTEPSSISSSSTVDVVAMLQSDEISIFASKVLKQLYDKSPALVKRIAAARIAPVLDGLVGGVNLSDTDSRVVLRAVLQLNTPTEENNNASPVNNGGPTAASIRRLL